MRRMRILPEVLSNKIAAGEVVERPASVVKELMENALDAGGTRIVIDIENGGRALIRVGDDGTGMNHDEALLSLERFATSKIHRDDDLFAIKTLGFRGEALPSMAAVSRMTLVTRTRDADSGVAVRIHGGKIVGVSEAGAAPGTVVSVARLFYNTPARRKFLKSVATEMGHIADTVAGMALGRPRVYFKLTHNHKAIKQWTATKDPARRVAEVLGKMAGGDLVGIDAAHEHLKLSGFLGPSRLARGNSRGVYLYVNGRRVRDRIIQHALFEGYGRRLMKGQFPLAVLFLQLPGDQVDVNVHPAKHEIRFVNQRRVHDLVSEQVAKALSTAERRLWATERAPMADQATSVAQPNGTYGVKSVQQPRNDPDAPSLFTPTSQQEEQAGRYASDEAPQPTSDGDSGQISPDVQKPPRAVEKEQSQLWAARGFADLNVIGQFHGTYIICQGADGLILIDQHAAHERIVYERLRQPAGRIESQRLLMPETVELGFAEAPILEKLIPRLNEMGLEIEPFGGTTFVVKSVPVLLDDQSIEQVVIELVDKAGEALLGGGLEKVIDRCRMVMACHNAVRANQRLTREQIQWMLAQLDQCADPSHCPHGRPTSIRWTVRQLEKAFKRIV